MIMVGDALRCELKPGTGELGLHRMTKYASVSRATRLLPNAIVQKLTLTNCGIFEEMTEGSTKPVAQIRTNAGIARMLPYGFSID
jgi:hypothetical protein